MKALPGTKEQVGQMEKAGSVLDMENGRFQEIIQFLVEVWVIAETHQCQEM